MVVEQIYTGCLAQGAYYIRSGNEAAIIDPLREVGPYLDRLEKDGVTLKYVFETHFHADFVSGHLDLSKKTGAPIVYGPNAEPAFEAIIAKDQQVFQIGDVTITAIHTPGHTLESTCYLLKDAQNQAHAIFTGDTLFLGDVGRPDLAQKIGALTMADLAGMLYDSIYQKIMILPDSILVYPAHGAGSACGKNMMKETVDTLGNQKAMNYALNQPNKEAFIEAVTEGLSQPPGYFGYNVQMNKHGYESFDTVLQKGSQALSPRAFEAAAEETGALILDTRNPNIFWKAFVPNSINIGLNGDFAPWVGAMIVDVKQPLLLVTEEGKVEETITRLSRVGFDNVLGYLEGGIEAWIADGRTTDQVNRIDAQALENIFMDAPQAVIDVRKEGEFVSGHIANASYCTLSDINQWISTLPKEEPFVLHCAGGYRSMIAASILQSRGYRNFVEIEGGFNAIKQTQLPIQSGQPIH